MRDWRTGARAKGRGGRWLGRLPHSSAHGNGGFVPSSRFSQPIQPPNFACTRAIIVRRADVASQTWTGTPHRYTLHRQKILASRCFLVKGAHTLITIGAVSLTMVTEPSPLPRSSPTSPALDLPSCMQNANAASQRCQRAALSTYCTLPWSLDKKAHDCLRS
jgi:hypothetical protein